MIKTFLNGSVYPCHKIEPERTEFDLIPNQIFSQFHFNGKWSWITVHYETYSGRCRTHSLYDREEEASNNKTKS